MLSPKQTAQGTGSEAATRLLVVDDNEDAAELLSVMLTKAGYIVRTAFDGPSALLVATDFRPQLALLDIGLPVMDGYELGRRLRGMPEAPRLIALTGYGQASDQARSREAGFDAHMVKPIDFEQLRGLLETLLPSTAAV
jgi:CheY-like chemotaxis protein